MLITFRLFRLADSTQRRKLAVDGTIENKKETLLDLLLASHQIHIPGVRQKKKEKRNAVRPAVMTLVCSVDVMCRGIVGISCWSWGRMTYPSSGQHKGCPTLGTFVFQRKCLWGLVVTMLCF